MAVEIIALGKTKNKNLKKEINHYKDRLKAFSNVKYQIIPDVKMSSSKSSKDVKKEEALIIKKQIKKKANDLIILLDERGKQLTSPQFADFIQKKINYKNIKFLIGGVYGFDKSIYSWANTSLSFSKFTFTHQMIRLLLIEQIYRAFTIINNKQYHY